MDAPETEFSDRSDKVLRYCTTCPKMCRFSCPVAHEEARETVIPWGLVSLLHSASRGGDVAFDDALAETLMHCTGCMRCREACLHHNHVPRTLFEGRAHARKSGLESGFEPSPCGDADPDVVLDGVELGFAESADVAFFPGCAARQPGGDQITRFAKLFDALELDVALSTTDQQCCGYPLLAGGMDGRYRDRTAEIGRALATYDAVVTDCDDFVQLARTRQWRDDLDDVDCPDVLHWTEFLAAALHEAGVEPVSPLPGDIFYFDGCRLGRGAGVYDAPRALLSWATGGAGPRELDETREWSWCCGAGAGYDEIAATQAAGMARHVIDGLPDDAVMVTTRSRCVEQLASAAGEQRVRRLFEVVYDAMDIGRSS